MNNYAKIIEYETFKKVTYYSVLFEEEELCEMDKFVTTFSESETHLEDFNTIISTIEQMGIKSRAHQRWFRDEEEAHALPPPTVLAQKQFNIKKVGYFTLRLFCICISDEVVILLNGGIKDANSLQECTTDIYAKFRRAKKIGKAITDKLSYPDADLIVNGKFLEGDFELIL